MAIPPPTYHRTLTGRARPRRTWFGVVVLQVEVLCERIEPASLMPGQEPRVVGVHTEWRDARMNDELGHSYRAEVQR
jgi:hypothetical protein